MRIDFIPQRITKYQTSQTKKNKGQKMKNLERIKRVLEIRRSNAATPIPSKKQYKRKPKNKREEKIEWQR